MDVDKEMLDTMGGREEHVQPVCEIQDERPILDTRIHKALTYVLRATVHYDPPAWAAVDGNVDIYEADQWDDPNQREASLMWDGQGLSEIYWRKVREYQRITATVSYTRGPHGVWLELPPMGVDMAKYHVTCRHHEWAPEIGNSVCSPTRAGDDLGGNAEGYDDTAPRDIQAERPGSGGASPPGSPVCAACPPSGH